MEHYYVVNGNEYGVDLDTKKNFTNIEDATKHFEEVKYDVEGFMNEWGLEWNEYVDKDAFIKAVIDEDGYGHTLNGYDGSADEVTIQDELFYVMRID